MYLVSTRFRFLPQHDTLVFASASEASEIQDISTRCNTNHSLPCGRLEFDPIIQIRPCNRNQSKSRCAAPHLPSLICASWSTMLTEPNPTQPRNMPARGLNGLGSPVTVLEAGYQDGPATEISHYPSNSPNNGNVGESRGFSDPRRPR
jgi:hypothetical protein